VVSDGGLKASETREAVDIEIMEMKRIEAVDFDFSNTHRRYDNVEAWYHGKGPEITVGEIKELLRGYEKGFCNHAEVNGRRIATIYSWIAPLGESYAYVCDGTPCENEYEKIEF